MMRLVTDKGGSCAVCGKNDGAARLEWDGGALTLCAQCRRELMSLLEAEAASGDGDARISDAARRVMAEAAVMPEEAFHEKYLADPIDMVIFEYVRGYGRAELDGQALSMISIMAEVSADEIEEHLQGLIGRGLLYPVEGRPRWYGADYPFADDTCDTR